MKETTASAKPLARPIGWRSVPALTAELRSRGPLLGPPPGDVHRSAQRRWRRALVRSTALPGDRSAVHIPSTRLAVPSAPGLRHAARHDYFHSPYFDTQSRARTPLPCRSAERPSAPTSRRKEHRRHTAQTRTLAVSEADGSSCLVQFRSQQIKE